MCPIDTKLCLSPNPSNKYHLCRRIVPCHAGLLFHRTGGDFRLASVAQCADRSRKGKPLHQELWIYGSWNRIARPLVSGAGWAYKRVMVTPCKVCPVLESYDEKHVKDRMVKEELQGWKWQSWVTWLEIMQDECLSREDKVKIERAMKEAVKIWKEGELAKQRVKERDFAEGEGVVRK